MATPDTTQLETIRDQAYDELETITGAPSATYELNGQDIEWADYVKSLRETVDWIDRKLAEYQPFVTHSEVRT